MTGTGLSIVGPALLIMLLLTSALVKLRTSSRAGLGLHLPSLLELLAALCVGVLSVSGSLVGGTGLWVVVGSVVLVVGSSVHLGRVLTRRHRLRELTEARRLETYVRYLTDEPR